MIMVRGLAECTRYTFELYACARDSYPYHGFIYPGTRAMQQ